MGYLITALSWAGKQRAGRGAKLGKGKTGGGLPATLRHTNPPLRLLPSGPDRVHGLSLRRHQQDHHRAQSGGWSRLRWDRGVYHRRNPRFKR